MIPTQYTFKYEASSNILPQIIYAKLTCVVWREIVRRESEKSVVEEVYVGIGHTSSLRPSNWVRSKGQRHTQQEESHGKEI